jgi:hypothetical protein
MPDEPATHGHQDPDAAEKSPTTELAPGDPGPIEVEPVMKKFVPPVREPMASRNLHLGESRDDDAPSTG